MWYTQWTPQAIASTIESDFLKKLGNFNDKK